MICAARSTICVIGARPRATARCPQTPAFRRRLAQAEADVEVAKLMGYEAASMLDSGAFPRWR